MKRWSRPKPTQETLALLKILALGEQKIREGKVVTLAEVVRRLRARRFRA